MARPITLTARPGAFHSANERLARAFDKLLDLCRRRADDERLAAVAVHPILERGDIDIDDVTVLQNGVVGDAVANDLVDGRAQ
jgi:hypothetical protein